LVRRADEVTSATALTETATPRHGTTETETAIPGA
jgi:hypothetical protein